MKTRDLNAFISEMLVGKKVIRKEPDGHVGVHVVSEVFFDENGAPHINDEKAYWTPASKLDIVED